MQTKGALTFLGVEKRVLYEVITIIVLSAIVVYRWFGDPTKYLIYNTDEFLPFSPSYYMQNLLSSWVFNGGTGSGNDPTYIVIVPPFYFLHNIIGLSLSISEYLIEVMFLSLSGISMLAFTETIYEYKLKSSFAPIMSAVLYMLSFYIYISLGELYNQVYFYSVLPLLMLLIYRSFKFLKTSKFPIKELLGIFIVVFFMTPALSWVFVEPLLFIFITYIIGLILYFRPKIRITLAYILSLILGTILVSLPTVIAILGNLSGVIALSKASTSLTNTPQWGWVVGNSENTNYLSAMAGMYKTPALTVIFYSILLILSVIPLLKKDNKDNADLKFHVYYLLFLELVFTPMIAGTTGPFGSIFTYLWIHSILFRPFISLTMDFGFVAPLVTSVLAPVGLKYIMEKVSIKRIPVKRANIGIYVGAMIILLMLFFGVANTSAITGSWATQPTYGPGTPSPRIHVPTYQYTAEKFFKSNLQPWQRIVELPMQGPEVGTPWYYATNIFSFMGISVISGTYLPGNDTSIYYIINSQVYENNTANLANELAAFGVKYVVVVTQNKPTWSPIPITPQTPYLLEENLNATHGLRFVKQIGIYVIYQVNETLPLVYTEPSNLLGNGTVFNPNSTWINKTDVIKASYKILSPYEIEVNISNATQPYVLVYAETYDTGWSLIGANSTHVEVLGYANGWIINKKGGYTLTLFYTPQLEYQTFALISIISLMLFSIALIVLFLKNNCFNIYLIT